jgi:ribosome-binding protein aMBF1 (putative translation factor)
VALSTNRSEGGFSISRKRHNEVREPSVMIDVGVRSGVSSTDGHADEATATPTDESFPVGHHPPRRTLPPDLASALWRAREKSGLTNRQVAAQAGIDPSYLSKLVRGSRCPSLVTTERIISVLPLRTSEQEALRGAAVQDRGKSRSRR